jgi:hypothetical protein
VGEGGEEGEEQERRRRRRRRREGEGEEEREKERREWIKGKVKYPSKISRNIRRNRRTKTTTNLADHFNGVFVSVRQFSGKELPQNNSV